ncbi:MAG TPA: TlpA disulfide reductase family protein [Vicinamibacteria bacterium]|nr:TlpA disulfide reductase family protein [Vicinamibacteria bacterium]
MGRYPGRVRFVEENFGESELASRFGVEQYPAIFVDEALIANPWDFFEWPDQPKGRYVPWLEAASREKFVRDLDTFVQRRLAGEKLEGVQQSSGAPRLPVTELPSFEAVTLAGERISRESLRGRTVLVEFWATWCPPCRPTLSFLGEMERNASDHLAVVGIAVGSKEEEVRKLLTEMEGAPSDSVMGADELVAKFGPVLAVPTLMVFGPDGKTADVFYGAPPDLHDRVKRLVEALGH